MNSISMDWPQAKESHLNTITYPFSLSSDMPGRISFDVCMDIDITRTSPKYEVISTTQKQKKCLTCCTIACPEPKCFQVLYEFLSLHHNLSGPISVSRYPSTIKKNSISSNMHFSLRFLYCQTHIFIDVAIKIAYQKAQV